MIFFISRRSKICGGFLQAQYSVCTIFSLA